MIHITDAPCHGRQYHDSTIRDDYPQGDPAGLQLDSLMKQLVEKEIAYYFGHIKKATTQAMIMAFSSSMKAASKGVQSIQQFDAQDANKFLEGVFRSVTCSIVTTIGILMTEGARELHQYTIEEKIPNWDLLPTKSVSVTPPPTIGSGAKLETPKQLMNVKIASQPFSEGGQKIVYHAFDVDEEKHIVLNGQILEATASKDVWRQLISMLLLLISVLNSIVRNPLISKQVKSSFCMLELWK